MTGKTIHHLLYTLLVAGVLRRSKCDFLDDAAFDKQAKLEYLNEYILVDDKYLKMQEIEDTSFEIDLINRNRKTHRVTHEEPRVLYQVGVSLIVATYGISLQTQSFLSSFQNCPIISDCAFVIWNTCCFFLKL